MSDSLSERLDCLTRVSCENTPERLYATAAGVGLNETETVAILVLFSSRSVQLGFLSKLHILDCSVYSPADITVLQTSGVCYEDRSPQ